MNARFLFALLVVASCSACSNKEEPSNPTGPVATAAQTTNSGRILQLVQAAGYSYAEVKTSGGQVVWIAGGTLQLQVGDSVQWGDYAVMRNFSSKALGRTFEQILFVNAWGAPGGVATQVAPHGVQLANYPQQRPNSPIDTVIAGQGQVKSVVVSGGYTYLEIVQDSSTIWLATPKSTVKAGEKVAWNGGAVMQNFAAKALGRTFDQIIFVGGITTVP